MPVAGPLNEMNPLSDPPPIDGNISTEESNHGERPRPWGFWATIGFFVLLFIVMIGIQTVVMVGYLVVAKMSSPGLELLPFMQSLATDGLFLAISTIVTTPFCIGLTVLFVVMRKGMTVKDYLCLKPTTWKEICLWLAALIVFIVVSDGVSVLLDRPVVPDFMMDAYSSAKFPPLLWIALIVAAPLFEETFFRGFMFTGIQHSRLGTVGAVLVTSLVWAMIHLQYDLYGISFIFVGGLLLGYVRFRTGSIYPPIAMHAFMNLVATAEVIIVIAGKGQ